LKKLLSGATEGSTMAFDVDFFIIGAGSGGVQAARIAAGHGAKTLVAEESRVGGTCVLRGCVPKKLYVYASRFADDFHDAAGFGWSVGEARFDWPTLVAAKNKEIDRLSDAYRDNLVRSGAKLVEERAAVVDPHRVRLAGGREISARHILIASGSRPTLLPGVEGVEHAITSNEIFDLPEFPRRLLVVGGGDIAVEFASLFQRLGAEVTQVMRASNILRGFDEDIRNGMRDAMKRNGIVHRLGCLPTRIENQSDGSLRVTLSDGAVFEVEQALIATGRLPDTKGLGLEAAGVDLNAAHGAVKVHENLTTTCRRSTQSATSPIESTSLRSPFAKGTRWPIGYSVQAQPRSAMTRSRARCSARPKSEPSDSQRRRPLSGFRRSTFTKPICGR
jgi:glutathione reductase (NADPH)